MSTAVELPGLAETQRQIVELAREFARTKIEPFAAEWDRRAHFARGGDLLEREQVGDAVEPHPVVLLGRAHAEEPEPAELVDHVAGEVRPPVPFRRERLDLGAREFARQLDDLTLRFRSEEHKSALQSPMERVW